MKLKTIILTLVFSASLLAMETEEENTSISQHNLDVTCLDLSHDESLTDISFIAKFTELKELNLKKCYNLGNNYYPVLSLTKLTHLNLDNEYLSDLTPIVFLVNLTSLKLQGSSTSTISPLLELRNLKNLNLRACMCIEDIHLLGKMTQLEKLDISGVYSNENIFYLSLRYLEKLVNLRTLNISHNAYLFDLAPIKNISSLTHLYIGHCRNVDNYDFLLECHALKKITTSRYSGGKYTLSKNLQNRLANIGIRINFNLRF